MAIEKMKLLSLVGALDEEHTILEELVLCENIHLDLEHSDGYDNNYIMHEYEAMLPVGSERQEENILEEEMQYQTWLNNIEKVCEDLDLHLTAIKEDIRKYPKSQAIVDLDYIEKTIGPGIQSINDKKKQIESLQNLSDELDCIKKNINFDELNALEYFEYQIGLLSRDNSVHIKKNYENISALIFEIGEIEDSRDDLYIIIYLEELKDETEKLLKSLNWSKLDLGEKLTGDVTTSRRECENKIDILKKQIFRLEKDIFESKEEVLIKINRIYTRIRIEQKIIELKKQAYRGANVFVLNGWIRAREYNKLERSIEAVTNQFVMMGKSPEELGEEVLPPTMLKNNWFTRPFEMIVRLYGLPQYDEIDPTPFLAVTFCLMFGIMFGDVGQGLVYFLAGCLLSKKMEVAAGILKRLGGSSIIFGFVYGSVFGLEELPIIEDIALVHGGPLNTNNIMPILIAGVAFGVGVLTISFLFGIINAFRRRDLENALFGKNGIAGYIFFMGLIFLALCLVNVISVSVLLPAIVMVIMLLIMIFKEPLIHLMKAERPLIHGDASSYYIEGGFEGIETILSTLSNAISFIRVGAFALNHAGLFLAFSVMAGMVDNILLKILIIVIGNILILTLEGLVVFIQGLRLQYYEMFSKYFGGDGIAYSPLKIEE